LRSALPAPPAGARSWVNPGLLGLILTLTPTLNPHGLTLPLTPRGLTLILTLAPHTGTASASSCAWLPRLLRWPRAAAPAGRRAARRGRRAAAAGGVGRRARGGRGRRKAGGRGAGDG